MPTASKSLVPSPICSVNALPLSCVICQAIQWCNRYLWWKNAARGIYAKFFWEKRQHMFTGIIERLCHYVQRIVHLLNNNSCHITGPRRDRHLTAEHQVLIWAELSIMRWILSELLHGKIRYIN